MASPSSTASHRDYEHHVADVLASEGWQATVTPAVRDFGVDILAERDGIRLGVQAKMYGSGRKVSGRMVQEFFGAAALADCDRSMIATNGRVLPEARSMADKLGIEVRHIEAKRDPIHDESSAGLSFDEIWTQHLPGLIGQPLLRANGDRNEVVSVDGSALVRITSNGRTQPIEIEIFRWAIERLLAGHIVTRTEIDENSKARASSGILLILGSLPMFEQTKDGRTSALRMIVPASSAAA
jgi:restriction system protein